MEFEALYQSRQCADFWKAVVRHEYGLN